MQGIAQLLDAARERDFRPRDADAAFAGVIALLYGVLRRVLVLVAKLAEAIQVRMRAQVHSSRLSRWRFNDACLMCSRFRNDIV
jgi:hypothetical protein